ncbi:MAG: ATP-binding cassette domain-containing protein, partial [Sinobacteraceae bacterium]|nr:ATP-binding cassette domain-containing protein [Nevskiaceae bacterium]
MLNLTDVTVRRGTRVLFEGATFALFSGEKVGITGANGSGKSSLLALVRGELHADSGTVDIAADLQIAYVAQELLPSERAAIEFVLDGDERLRQIEARIAQAQNAGLQPAASQMKNAGLQLAEAHTQYGAAGGYDARSRAARLMHGLGFAPGDEARPVSAFSGGWRVRLNLAQALMCRSDLLLLDEPTNHLDLDAILWLESWLQSYPGTLLLISHDREFLDRIVGRIVHLEHGRARVYRGNYSSFEAQRATELAQQTALYSRQVREIHHMEAFIARFRAQATKARQAQSRLKALERMQRIAPAHVDSPFEFSFAAPEKLPRPLLAVEKQLVGYGAEIVLSDVTLSIAPGDRLAILGRNGAGKSTLMRLLAGELTATAGTRTEARELRIGYFAQHQLEQLDGASTPLGNLRRLGGVTAERATEQELRDFLAGFGFRGERVFDPGAPFSGGEKARLVLGLIAWVRPNLMLLDEPTNHLDLEMRQALAMALQDYAGAVVLVSHDRHLLRSVSDEFLLVHERRVQPFDGDLEDYARWLTSSAQDEKAQAAADAAVAATDVDIGRDSADARRQRKREEAERRNR